jgi:hypothetical protein
MTCPGIARRATVDDFCTTLKGVGTAALLSSGDLLPGDLLSGDLLSGDPLSGDEEW